MREAWQQPLAQTGYAGEGAFPLVSLLTPKMRARIVLTGDPDALDVFSSQLQVEAVFNRGLTLKKAYGDGYFMIQILDLVLTGWV